MKVVVAVEDVDAFCCVPGEALGWEEVLGGYVVVGEGYDAAVDVDVVP